MTFAGKVLLLRFQGAESCRFVNVVLNIYDFRGLAVWFFESFQVDYFNSRYLFGIFIGEEVYSWFDRRTEFCFGWSFKPDAQHF